MTVALRYFRVFLIVPLTIVCLFSVSLFTQAAESSSRPIISAFERFHAKPGAGNADAGRLLLGELSCTSCHAAEGASAAWVDRKQPPILDEVAARVKPAYLREYLNDPHSLKPGATMPNLLAGLGKKQRQEQVEALVHFLVSLRPEGPAQAVSSIGWRTRGELLYHSVGCAVCHGSRKDGAKPLATDKPLGELEKKYTLPALAAFLADPLHSRPSGRMPSLNLSGVESRAVAAYLLPSVPEKTGLTYKYYEGSWQSLPDFSKLKAKAVGGAEKIDVSPKQRGDQFGLRFDGALSIEADGEYTFHLGSDDGSSLKIDDKLIVSAPGLHGFAWLTGKTHLTKGVHHVQIDYFEQGSAEKLEAEFEGPGIKRRKLAEAIVAAQPEAKIESLAFKVNADLAKEGQALFASVGCASCHQIKTKAGEEVASKLTAAPLAKLKDGGCVSDSPTKGLPDYRLSAHQRLSLTAAITSIRKTSGGPTAKQTVTSTMERFNCYACHQRGELGGVEPDRNPLFTGTQPEMGDEGRIPPPLDGVGGKLTALWLDHILADGAKDRPYMLTRMPKFGAKNAGHLRKILEVEDKLKPLPKITLKSEEAKVAGWQMVGSKGFGCINCHTFGHFKATGVQSIDMIVMSKRLREPWFRRYVDSPQIFRKGTRMPDAWPATNGNSLLGKILDGKNDTQIQAVWNYLADGPRARTPAGLVTNGSLLTPSFEAVLYRNFIQGAGPRAIGVGYPEGINLAFDANSMRLALMWQGAFIDPSKHWTGRGQGFQVPAGQAVVKLPAGTTFAVLENKDAAWPTGDPRSQGYRFRGYQLSKDRRPTFRYDCQTARIEDFPNPVEEGVAVTLSRSYRVTSDKPSANLWLRAAIGGKIEAATDGWYSVDGQFQTRLTKGKPVLRTSGGKTELLVPVVFTGISHMG